LEVDYFKHVRKEENIQKRIMNIQRNFQLGYWLFDLGCWILRECSKKNNEHPMSNTILNLDILLFVLEIKSFFRYHVKQKKATVNRSPFLTFKKL
jgi:hypothetical protein